MIVPVIIEDQWPAGKDCRILELALVYAHAADIAVVEDFSDNLTELDEDIVNQAEDTMTILNKYIDGLTLNVESVKLKNIMKELYIESLNVEVTE